MRHLQKILMVLLLVSISLLEGCIQPVYLPNKVTAPLFHGNEKYYISASGVEKSGFTAAIAYSPVKSFYIGAGGNITSNVTPYTSDFSTKFIYGEIGGYREIDPVMSLEFCGGFGAGASETYDNNTSENTYYDSLNIAHTAIYKQYDHSQVRYTREHLQGTLGLHFDLSNEKDNGWRDLSIELGLSARLSFLQLSRYDVDHLDSNKVITSSDQRTFSSQIFIEPAFTLRFGVEHYSMELQVGSSKFLGQQKSLPAGTTFISIGLVSRF